MNTFEFKETIIDIVKEYPENKVARIFALYSDIYNQSRDNLFENILNIYETNSLSDLEINYDNIEINEYVNIDEIKNKDFRIKTLTISNLRGFPSLEDSELFPYGIDFTNKESVDSLLVLANNGTGKSSLFNALEYTYTNQIGEKRIRSMKDEISELNFEQYLHRFNSNSQPIFDINTFNGNYNIYNKIFDNKLLKYINPKCNFISEYDIIAFGKTDYNFSSNSNHSFHNIIAKSLGLEEYIDFSNKLSELNSYKRRKDLTTRNSIHKEISLLNENLNSRQEKIKKIEEEIDNFTSNNESKINNINEELINTIKSIKDSKLSYAILSNDFIEDVDKFKSTFNRFRFNEKNRVNLDEQSFLEKGESILHLYQDCPFCLNSKSSFNDIRKETEERILKLKNISNQQLQLKDLYKKITSTLNSIFNNLHYTYNFISNEREKISKFKEFDNLLEFEDKFYFLLSPIVSDDDNSDYINKIANTRSLDNKDLEDLYNYISLNDNFINQYIHMNNEIKYFNENRNLILNKILNNNVLFSNEKLTIEKLNREKFEILKSIESINDKINLLSKDLNQVNFRIETTTKLKSDLQKFLIHFDRKKDQLVLDNFHIIKDNVLQLINEFIGEEEKIELRIELENHEFRVEDEIVNNKYIVAKIYDKENNISTTPDIYFNTFRYKLFCLITNLSLAIAVRKKYNINLPLVIDDIFYSSDYNNKLSFSQFLEKIIILFNKHTPELPLQLILFTHDDTIFSSSIDTLDFIGIKYPQLQNSFRIARMFSLYEKDEIPNKFKSSGSLFWNITYTLNTKQTR